MSYLLSSHSAYCEGTELYATCRGPILESDNAEDSQDEAQTQAQFQLLESFIDLNDHLGNNGGALDVNGSDLNSTSARPYLIDEHIFQVDLEDAASGAMITRTYDLSLSVVNVDGILTFVKPYVIYLQ